MTAEVVVFLLASLLTAACATLSTPHLGPGQKTTLQTRSVDGETPLGNCAARTLLGSDTQVHPTCAAPASLLAWANSSTLSPPQMEAGDCEILQAKNDRRLYRRIELPNGLQALLISDDTTDKAAAALDVNAGHFCDPESIPGLAHFLEHMLFFSSDKYPTEYEYLKFLTEHGGRGNAFTDTEHTNYHFDIGYKHLEEALDRFAQFFICPLLSGDATSREMNAVDSEHSKNLLSDGWRLRQVIICSSSYDLGNLETLDVVPKAAGQDVQVELLRFYEQHYSANLMRLVVYGRESLERLQEIVEAKFASVRNTQLPKPGFPGKPCSKEHLQVMIKAVPVTEGDTLDLVWPTPPDLVKYRAAPSRYLGHLIGHEANGSLFALLKRLGWASSLSAGESESSQEYAFFTISIELTKVGQGRVQDIVRLTLHYIDLLRQEGVQEWIFNEVKEVADFKFHFADKQAPLPYVSGLADNLQHYPPEDWLAGPHIPRVFDASSIHEVLGQMTYDNLRILWCSKSFPDDVMKREHWYGTQYQVVHLTPEWIEEPSIAGLQGELHLPSPNDFIPTDFTIKHSTVKMDCPALEKQTEMGRLWCKHDSLFATPKALIRLSFTCPATSYSPEHSLLTQLFTKLLADGLNEYAYYAQIAGLSYSIQHTTVGFQVFVSGYSHKLMTLLEKILSKAFAFDFTDDRFHNVQETTFKEYLNFKYHQPYYHGIYSTSYLLEHKTWHISEYTNALPELGPEDLRAFYPKLLSQCFFECFVAGNFLSEEAVVIFDKVESMLQGSSVVCSKPLLASQHAERRIAHLSACSSYYLPLPVPNEVDENSALQFYLQITQDSPALNVLGQLYVQTAKQAAFYQLRTIEQLGYLVWLLTSKDGGVHSIQFVVQSSTEDPAVLEQRVEAFLESQEKALVAMSSEDFMTNVSALIALKEEKYKNLFEESNFFWGEIDDGTLHFDRVNVEVAALRKLRQEDLLGFYCERIKKGGPQRRKLSVQVLGSSCRCNGPNQTTQAPGARSEGENISKVHSASNGYAKESQEGELVKDLNAFKRSQSLYPSLKGRLAGL
eukprot:SM000168S02624  [mRNA]  locus=s168:264494:272208:+ [translate_table: standard]